MSEDRTVVGDNRTPLTGPRHYDASKNTSGESLPGVPLRDLSAEEFEALPVWLQYSIDAQPFYRKTKPAAHAPTQADKATGDSQ